MPVKGRCQLVFFLAGALPLQLAACCWFWGGVAGELGWLQEMHYYEFIMHYLRGYPPPPFGGGLVKIVLAAGPGLFITGPVNAAACV
jgi:hypothetical protein